MNRERPVLLFDGDCAFCTRTADMIKEHIPTSGTVEPWQFVDLAALGTTREQAEHEVVWVGRDGRVRGGAQAVAALLIDAGTWWAVLGWTLRIPPIRWVAHLGYRLVAANRHRLPGGTPACALPSARPVSRGDQGS
jgi:predicted DCC family thiol-disulfide oxidoreductase YuxK